MSPEFVNGINFLASISSLILAVLSIWLAIYFYNKSKEAEQKSTSLLIKTEQQISLMRQITTKMLNKYVDYSITPHQNDEITNQLLSMLQGGFSSGAHNSSITGSTTRKPNLDLVTSYIATMYWSGVANVVTQESLPVDPAQMVEADFTGLGELLRMSKSDYNLAKSWIEENGGEFIERSTAAGYYQQLKGTSLDIRDAGEVYAYRSSQAESSSVN